ncbi:MAG: STAS domain-containing protein [Clostridiales bacterium]|nr:STAS domain-containing protein [Clostridiales bacterium]
MTITKTQNGDSLTIAIEGRLDTITAPQLESELRPVMDNIKELIFDLKDLVYISSAGLRVLLASQKNMNKRGDMCIRNVSADVMEVFELTGFVDILNIEE